MQQRKKRVKKEPPISLSSRPVIWGRGNMVRVRIGRRVCQLAGVQKGRRFLVNSRQRLHWGLGSGPSLTREELAVFIPLLERSSKASPWMQIQFQ